MSVHVTTPHEVDPPQSVRDLTTLGRVDYLDAFVAEVDPDDPGRPQAWARAMFEGIGRRERLEFQLVWRALGLRLGCFRPPTASWAGASATSSRTTCCCTPTPGSGCRRRCSSAGSGAS